MTAENSPIIARYPLPVLLGARVLHKLVLFLVAVTLTLQGYAASMGHCDKCESGTADSAQVLANHHTHHSDNGGDHGAACSGCGACHMASCYALPMPPSAFPPEYQAVKVAALEPHSAIHFPEVFQIPPLDRSI